MTDSGIKETLYATAVTAMEDICSDPQFAILKVEQKFQAHKRLFFHEWREALMDDEQAEECGAKGKSLRFFDSSKSLYKDISRHFLNLIDESVGA